MPLPQLDETQQQELDALIATKSEEFHKTKLSELGYDDHAKNVIGKANKQAQAERETRERIEKDLNDLKAANKKRDDDAAAAAAEAAKKKKQQEDEEKPLKDQLAEIRQTFQGELDKRDQAAKTERKELEKKLQARDEILVRKTVIGALKDKGANAKIAELLAGTSDLSIVTVEDGEINDEELDALVDAISEENKDLFKAKDDDEEGPQRDERGQFVRPRGGTRSAGKDKDASKLSDPEFEAMEAGLRSGRS